MITSLFAVFDLSKKKRLASTFLYEKEEDARLLAKTITLNCPTLSLQVEAFPIDLTYYSLVPTELSGEFKLKLI